MRALLVAAILTGCTAVTPVDAADPRFETCGGTIDSVDATVEFTARDYHDHFPLMGESPELNVDAPAFAVVFGEAGGPPIPITGQISPGDQQAAPPRAEAEHRTVCIVVGLPPDGVMHVYVDVDVALLLP